MRGVPLNILVFPLLPPSLYPLRILCTRISSLRPVVFVYICSFLQPATHSSLHFGAVFRPPTMGDVETLEQVRPRSLSLSLYE